MTGGVCLFISNSVSLSMLLPASGCLTSIYPFRAGLSDPSISWAPCTQGVCPALLNILLPSSSILTEKKKKTLDMCKHV